MVAPKCLQNKVIELIERETEKAKRGEDAYIGIKINSLTDKKIMNQLIKASRAGVKIDMIVRGICCLRSKIEGYTDNIRIISIVGRYLEHSRIYIFGKDKEEKMYISSADLMTRNTVRRLEVAVPIYDDDIKNRIRTMFQTMLQDNVKAREQMPDGKYQKLKKAIRQLNSQEYFYEQAYDMAGNGLVKKEEEEQQYNEEDFIIEDKEMAEVTEKSWEQAAEATEEETTQTLETMQQQKYNKKAKRYRRSSRNRKR